MKLFKILAIAAMAMVSSSSVNAGVVLSNIGANANDLSTLGTGGSFNINPTNSIFAGGFRTGGSTGETWNLKWFRGAFYHTAPTSTRVQIFAADSSTPRNPTGAALFTSDATLVTDSVPSSTPLEFYTFKFNGDNGITLAANTSYFVVPVADVPAPGFSWYINFDNEFPTEQNSSGWSRFANRQSTNGGTSWGSGNQAFTMAFNATLDSPVPEPALTSLLCLSGIALIRRRMKK